MVDEGFKRIVHVAIMVEDIEEARAAWAELLGMEEPQIVETESRESTHMIFKGKPSEGRAKLAFFRLENIALELIEPIGGPSTWRNFLEKQGRGIHHLGFMVENMEETLGKLGKMGIGVEQKAEYKGGRYAYVDSKGKLGAIVEILHSDG